MTRGTSDPDGHPLLVALLIAGSLYGLVLLAAALGGGR